MRYGSADVSGGKNDITIRTCVAPVNLDASHKACELGIVDGGLIGEFVESSLAFACAGHDRVEQKGNIYAWLGNIAHVEVYRQFGVTIGARDLNYSSDLSILSFFENDRAAHRKRGAGLKGVGRLISGIGGDYFAFLTSQEGQREV